MNKLLLVALITALLFGLYHSAQSQITLYWRGGNSQSWMLNNAWNTEADGSGTAQTWNNSASPLNNAVIQSSQNINLLNTPINANNITFDVGTRILAVGQNSMLLTFNGLSDNGGMSTTTFRSSNTTNNRTLTMQAGSDSSFSGLFNNNSSAVLNLTKTGNGILTLNNASSSTSTGSVNVNAGGLILNSSATNSFSSYTVNGATFGRTALSALSIDANVTFSTGSTLRIGYDAVANASLNRTGGTWSFLSDQAVALTGTGGVRELTNIITGLDADPGVSEWTIATSGWDGFSFTYSDGAISVIPEPSTYAAIFGLLALGVVAWRRRR